MIANTLKSIGLLSLFVSSSLMASTTWEYFETTSRGYKSLDIKGNAQGVIECTQNGEMVASVNGKKVKKFIIDGLHAEPIAFMLQDRIGYIQMDDYIFEGIYEDIYWDELERCYPIQKEH